MDQQVEGGGYCQQSYDDREDRGPSYNGRNQGHGPRDSSDDKDTPQCLYGQGNPESTEKGVEVFVSFASCNMSSSSNGWFFWRWVSSIRFKLWSLRQGGWKCLPLLGIMGRRSNFCRSLIRILPCVRGRNIESFPCCGMFVRKDGCTGASLSSLTSMTE